MNVNTQAIAHKISELISTPEVGAVVGVSTGFLGFLNTFMQEFPIIHDGISLVALVLGCVLSYITIRIYIVNWRIRKMEAREIEIRLLRQELAYQKEQNATE